MVCAWLEYCQVSETNEYHKYAHTPARTRLFPQEVQVLKALVLGEEERGQSQYQVMCFLTKLKNTDFISTDAMAKLRQVSGLF